MVNSLKDIQAKVEQAIVDKQFLGQSEELYEPINYLMAIGGKRIRPVMLLAAYNLFKDDIETVIDSALAIEVFHNFTLMHDDLMDEASLRRGQQTVHKKYDANTAILSGDVMLVYAYQLLSSCDAKHLKRILAIFNKTAIEVCEGQQMDMNFETRDHVAQEEYLEMIKLKTAVLLAASLSIGGILADASEKDANLLYQFGIDIGIGFQLQDDLLDAFGDEKTFGKKIGGDIVQNKKTFLLINALDRNSELMLDAMSITEPEQKIKTVKGIYEELKLPQMVQQKIDEYSQKAVTSLENLDINSSNKDTLYELVEMLRKRAI